MGRATVGVDPAELAAYAAGQPLSRTRLRELLARRWPDRDRSALLHSVQYLLPLVHLPPAGTWGGRVDGPCGPAEGWLGAPLDVPDPAVPGRRAGALTASPPACSSMAHREADTCRRVLPSRRRGSVT
ncbi:hypothetical protein RMN56_31295 [Micromonospora halotolerans]|uniref:Uncharacterized protein n=1 Tax=Micromonospora halotolerans TaxID=709879 RepID=A0ABY9ZY85_9ACTN|nr:hypothetical protein [Micromonospora halotolerans]WNM39540.1 hypothetical protein RMN56_31295 [Micromonospora halotolerans]